MTEKFFSKPQIIALSVLAATTAASISYYYYPSSKQSVKETKGDLKVIGESESNVDKVIKDDYNKSFAMDDNYFGKKREEIPNIQVKPEEKQAKEVFADIIDNVMNDKPEDNPPIHQPRPNQVFKPEPEPKVEIRPEPIKIKPKKPTSLPDFEVISYDDEEEQDDPLNLLADKDYPKTIASNPYDLSRILTTDSFIPAVLYTAINSEIPSKTVLAIVESDVVGFHGNYILIPKGSRVEGVFEALEDKHARRMQITWFKITRPDGIIIKLEAESGDIQGASGLTGYLDQRLKDRYGGAILLSSINSLAQLSINSNDLRQLAAVESMGREIGTLTAQIIRENLNVKPIIMINQGQRFNIRPTQNIYFKEPKKHIINTIFVD